jgi:hypothetical protein
MLLAHYAMLLAHYAMVLFGAEPSWGCPPVPLNSFRRVDMLACWHAICLLTCVRQVLQRMGLADASEQNQPKSRTLFEDPNKFLVGHRQADASHVFIFVNRRIRFGAILAVFHSTFLFQEDMPVKVKFTESVVV